jgi:sterol desaturase/sphingolipid hydroxylase (fatty acid hydroxylase superfamily)
MWLDNEPIIRIGAYTCALLAVGLAEIFWPRRTAQVPRRRRWPGNLLIAALGALFVRALLPVGLVGLALGAAEHGLGLLNRISLPAGTAIVGSIVVLDLVVYAQHVAFHKVSLLWRVHRMHHTDLHVDVTTGVRFHPLELALSAVLKGAAVVLLGAPAAAVLVFEVLLNATAMFNHGNLRLPGSLDRWLRALIVTPDMHRVHHSADKVETDSNFGFNLPWWDRLFGTYRAVPALGHDGMQIGLAEFRAPEDSRLDRLLLQPLRQPESR